MKKSFLRIDKRPLGIIDLRRRLFRPRFSLVFALPGSVRYRTIHKCIRISVSPAGRQAASGALDCANHRPPSTNHAKRDLSHIAGQHWSKESHLLSHSTRLPREWGHMPESRIMRIDSRGQLQTMPFLASYLRRTPSTNHAKRDLSHIAGQDRSKESHLLSHSTRLPWGWGHMPESRIMRADSRGQLQTMPFLASYLRPESQVILQHGPAVGIGPNVGHTHLTRETIRSAQENANQVSSHSFAGQQTDVRREGAIPASSTGLKSGHGWSSIIIQHPPGRMHSAFSLNKSLARRHENTLSMLQSSYTLQIRSAIALPYTIKRPDIVGVRSNFIPDSMTQDRKERIRESREISSHADFPGLVLTERTPVDSRSSLSPSIVPISPGHSKGDAPGIVRSNASFGGPFPQEESGQESFQEPRGLNANRIADSVYEIIVRRIKIDMERRGFYSRA